MERIKIVNGHQLETFGLNFAPDQKDKNGSEGLLLTSK